MYSSEPLSRPRRKVAKKAPPNDVSDDVNDAQIKMRELERTLEYYREEYQNACLELHERTHQLIELRAQLELERHSPLQTLRRLIASPELKKEIMAQNPAERSRMSTALLHTLEVIGLSNLS